MKFTRLIYSLLVGLSSTAFAQTAPQFDFTGVDTTELWEQVGMDIDGEAVDDYSGTSVSISADGFTVAIGAPEDGNNTGYTRIYRFNAITAQWEQLGPDIDGDTAGDLSGDSVSLSADGLIVAVGAPFADGINGRGGHTRIYQYNEITSEWHQLGSDIDAEDSFDHSGESVSLSADGKTVAIGAPFNDGNGSGSGHTRIYQYNETSSEWNQLGSDIDGESRGDTSGESVSLSADGFTVAIGAPENDGSATGSGHTRIFQYNDTNNEWNQLGSDIDGESVVDGSGESVSLSADGLTVAIGASFADGVNRRGGHTRIYRFNETTNQWGQLGADIDGESEGDESGGSVSLSSDGLTLAIGARLDDGNGNNSGHVRIYKYNEIISQWEQIGTDIDGEAATDFFGESVSLSPDGLSIAVGAPSNDENGNRSGHTRIYHFNQVPHYLIAENTTFVTDVVSSDDVDIEGSGLVYSISGRDAEFFTINSETGVISFITAPDFEVPLDSDADNDYRITVSVTDLDNLTNTKTMLITVTNGNDIPSITSIDDITVNGRGEIVEFLLADDDGLDTLTVSSTSSNQNLVSNESLNITTSEGTYQLEILPLEGEVGVTIITITVSDGVNEVVESFIVTVINDTPSILGLKDITIGVGGRTHNFLVIDDSDDLAVTAISNNQNLIPNSSLILTSSGESFSLDIIPTVGQIGTTSITITASDGVNETTESFLVTVKNLTPRLYFSGQTFNNANQWEQLGMDIDGEAAGDISGEAVALSADGLIIAIGAPGNDGNGVNSGHTRIYRFSEIANQWNQLGNDIDGDNIGDESGEAVSLSADGFTLAVGTPGNDSGYTRIYRYNDLTNQWNQLGTDIDGEATGDGSGVSVSLSADGNTVAIGAIGNDDNGSVSGHTRIYRYNEIASGWIQLGSDIDGEAEVDRSGRSVSLSSDGLIVAIGATGNDDNGSSSGHTRIYRYNEVTTEWDQLGSDIDGEDRGDQSGFSVSLNGDGFIVAIGAPFNDDNGFVSGHTRIYQYNEISSRWNQLGSDIDGEAARDFSGQSVSLSEDGFTVAIGAAGNDDGSDSSGHTRIYEFNEITGQWGQLGFDIDGLVEDDRAGASVSISTDGRRVALGAPENDANGNGRTSIYSFISEPRYTIIENTTAITDVTATDDLDSEGSGLVYSLSGDDAGLLSISSTGLISFNTAPVFANPLDADGNNVYEITVTVTDSGGMSTSENLEITVEQAIVPGTGVTAITTGPDGELVFQITAVPGAVYAVEYSEDMQIWNTVETEIEATGNTIEWTDNGLPDTPTHPNVTDKRFYRFRLLSTPTP